MKEFILYMCRSTRGCCDRPKSLEIVYVTAKQLLSLLLLLDKDQLTAEHYIVMSSAAIDLHHLYEYDAFAIEATLPATRYIAHMIASSRSI